MIDVFNEALHFTLGEEGAYSNDPNDHGGETYCGIARKYHPSWDGWKIIDDIKEEYGGIHSIPNSIWQERVYPKVPQFYKDNYWKPLQLDKINLIDIAIKIFDMGVNLGVPQAASIVQGCLNLMSFGIDYEIRIDNIIGSITLNLINEMTKKDNGEMLLKLMTLQQGFTYMRIATNNPSQKEFIPDWIHRLHMQVKLI